MKGRGKKQDWTKSGRNSLSHLQGNSGVEMPIGVVPQDETGLGQSLQEGHLQEGRPWARRLSVAKAVSAGAGS